MDRELTVGEPDPGGLDGAVQVGDEHAREAMAGSAFAQFAGLAATHFPEAARNRPVAMHGLVVGGGGVCLVDDYRAGLPGRSCPTTLRPICSRNSRMLAAVTSKSSNQEAVVDLHTRPLPVTANR